MHRILVVEDNPDDAVLVQRAFHGDAFRFEVAKNGEEALKRLTQGSPNGDGFPSLILLDLFLPGMNGFEFLTAIKKHPRASKIPVVILTASDKEDDAARSLEFGAVKYLRKPLTPLTVGEIISDCLEK